MLGRLAGKVAIVTGGAGGIGRATVRRFCEEGAVTIVGDVDEEGGAETVRVCGENALFEKLDVSSEVSWKSVIDRIMQRFGRLDILVNNAARRTPLTLEQTGLAEWRANQGVTSEGAFLGTKFAAEHMTNGGSIVNVSSIAAFVGQPASVPYSAAKGAIRAFSRSIALHFAERKPCIRVNVVAPGATLTQGVARQMDQIAQREGATPEAVLARLASDTPMKRMADPAEIAEAILFLASDEASFITGSELVVDGGATAI